MRIKPDQRQRIAEICREELELATGKIHERLGEVEYRPAGNRGANLEEIRRFYEELVDKVWTQSDEECLESVKGTSETEIKQMMRETFRTSPVYPIPSFRYLINLTKKGGTEPQRPGFPTRNLEAFSAAERERLANLLEQQLNEAAQEIVSRLRLSESNGTIVREQLELVQGQIIARFSPLV